MEKLMQTKIKMMVMLPLLLLSALPVHATPRAELAPLPVRPPRMDIMTETDDIRGFWLIKFDASSKNEKVSSIKDMEIVSHFEHIDDDYACYRYSGLFKEKSPCNNLIVTPALKNNDGSFSMTSDGVGDITVNGSRIAITPKEQRWVIDVDITGGTGHTEQTHKTLIIRAGDSIKIFRSTDDEHGLEIIPDYGKSAER